MATLDFWGILGLINAEFPQYIPILKQPGVFDVFVRYAVAKSSGVNPWTPDQLLAELHKTAYFQTSDADKRSWDLLQATDPATAQQRADLVKHYVEDAMAATGVRLSQDGGFTSQYFQFFTKAVQQGWDKDRIRYELLALSSGEKGGDLAQSAVTIKGMANEYGVPLSDMAVQGWAKQLAQGAVTMDSIKGYLVEQAKSLFPSLAGALDRGITVAQYAAPYIQLAVQETGVNPAGISFTDPKWMQALNQVDPKTGQRTAMSLDQWLTTLRTDPRYGYDTTHKANQDASQLATMLEQRFGAAA